MSVQPALIVKLTVKPGTRDQAVEVFRGMLDYVDNEPGTLTYVLHTDDADADVLWFYELYTDSDAVQAHSSSATMKAVSAQVGELLAARPEFHMVTPVGGKGLPGS
jgi:quinol monooxygenase YgiN